MEIIYNDGEGEQEYRPIKKIRRKSTSTIASWLVDIKIVKNDRQGEMLSIIVIMVIFFVAGVIFAIGLGNNTVKDMKETPSEYLDNFE